MKYTIMMGCGHEDTVDLGGKVSDRERTLDYLKSCGLCRACYKKKMEEETAKKPLILNASVLPYISEETGNILVYAWFSGNTKPHKDAIKSLGYRWEERESASDFFSLKTEYCWAKTTAFTKLPEEIEKAKSIGAASITSEKGLMAMVDYQIALEKHRKWEEVHTKIAELAKPSVPDVLKGHRWNQKIYGKPGNHSVYPDGEKVSLTDEQAAEIEKYLKLKEEYQRKVKEIKNA